MPLEEIVSRGERTREDIIHTAFALFLKQGFHGTSMRQIATSAGIALGGIYNHFSSKEDLFVAVLDAYHPYHSVLPVMQAAQGETVEEFVRNAAQAMLASLDRNPDFIKLMFIEIVEFNSQHIPQIFEQIFPQVVEVVGLIMQRSEALRPIPVVVILRAFVGMFFSFYMTDMLLSRHMPEEMRHNAQEYFVDIFLHGILKGTN